MSEFPIATVARTGRVMQTWAGTDKFCRLIQYTCRALHWDHLQRDPKSELGLKLLLASQTLALHRKLFRAGNFIQELTNIYDTLNSLQARIRKEGLSLAEALKLFFTALKHGSGFCFFLHDHCVWMNKTKLSPAWIMKHEKAIAWRSLFWRVMMEVCGLPAIIIGLCQGYAKRKQLERDGSDKSSVELAKTQAALTKSLLSAQKSFFDLLTYWPQIPEFAWSGISESTGFHSGKIGWAGTISSVASVQLAWRATK